MKGYLDIVKVLVDAGALLNRTTRDGRTALYLAVQEGKYIIKDKISKTRFNSIYAQVILSCQNT